MRNTFLKIVKKLINIMYIIPLNKRNIIFTSYHGEGYSCSPKYISQYLYENKLNYNIIWAFKEPTKFDDILPKEIKKVRYKSFKYIYYTMTAGVRVNNAEEWIILPRRKGQLVINTWHGGGVYKKVGFDANYVKNTYLNNTDYYNVSNLFLSSCGAASKYMFRESFKYIGEILPCGLPRNDIFFKDTTDIVKSVKDKIGIMDNENTVLYAPTVRETNATEFEQINFELLLQALSSKFGGKWKILMRAHLGTTAGAGGGCEKVFGNSSMCTDVTEYPDMQELLLVSDILITDYSSSIWDYSFLKRPCFLYVPDLSVYQSIERGFYIDINEWGFPYATNNQELMKNIEQFNNLTYKDDVDAHHKMLESYEMGDATIKTVNYIVNWEFDK